MNKMNIGYPIKFTPILKEKIWGGTKLSKVLNKYSSNENIGESWELSGIKDDESIVSNGFFIGKSLNQIIRNYRENIVGVKVYDKFGALFPLLFKFIDANDDLSIQLHPNDELAKKRHNSFGKTEMWYVVDADSNARLAVGFNNEYSKEEYLNYLNSDQLIKMLNVFSIQKGDSFFIEDGTIHAIGKGSLIAEIQQTSDVTYRVFDWNRKDNFGNQRELHNELAIDALDFSKMTNCKIDYYDNKNSNSTIVDCNYFNISKVNVDSSYELEMKQLDSFVVYMCVEGRATIKVGKNMEEIDKGETILIPACVSNITIESESVELLEVYIK